MHNKPKGRYLKVEDKVNLVRDTDTNAIINTDTSGYQAYITNRERLLSDKERIEKLENQVSDIKGDLSDIKELLLKVLKEP
jgi:tetrahydromethanopterin S-methyltransferase subunit B